jgi:hypothetical protein
MRSVYCRIFGNGATVTVQEFVPSLSVLSASSLPSSLKLYPVFSSFLQPVHTVCDC